MIFVIQGRNRRNHWNCGLGVYPFDLKSLKSHNFPENYCRNADIFCVCLYDFTSTTQSWNCQRVWQHRCDDIWELPGQSWDTTPPPHLYATLQDWRFLEAPRKLQTWGSLYMGVSTHGLRSWTVEMAEPFTFEMLRCFSEKHINIGCPPNHPLCLIILLIKLSTSFPIDGLIPWISGMMRGGPVSLGGEEVDCSQAIQVILEINPHELKLGWWIRTFFWVEQLQIQREVRNFQIGSPYVGHFKKVSDVFEGCLLDVCLFEWLFTVFWDGFAPGKAENSMVEGGRKSQPPLGLNLCQVLGYPLVN